ncbi:aurora kinase [Toxoplasma gondii GAB2-2007-GAL-DOM2]|uniref:Aurora kinase n=4 Tax=Toxoplasma gondii TaxID=5811 RepID=S7W3S7_TOXGG|nr:aurora kinase [Toxoplasma gondii GT1]KAF4642871.1 aurora kinase [Toxoplasma gondii]KFG37712.1 aurora kinase [Toxoplasma gondii GAB2-2007-GAL-DOM2]KFG53712.1 aurora kinase [Toxoplasma gondii FOU]
MNFLSYKVSSSKQGLPAPACSGYIGDSPPDVTASCAESPFLYRRPSSPAQRHFQPLSSLSPLSKPVSANHVIDNVESPSTDSASESWSHGLPASASPAPLEQYVANPEGCAALDPGHTKIRPTTPARNSNYNGGNNDSVAVVESVAFPHFVTRRMTPTTLYSSQRSEDVVAPQHISLRYPSSPLRQSHSIQTRVPENGSNKPENHDTVCHSLPRHDGGAPSPGSQLAQSGGLSHKNWLQGLWSFPGGAWAAQAGASAFGVHTPQTSGSVLRQQRLGGTRVRQTNQLGASSYASVDCNGNRYPATLMQAHPETVSAESHVAQLQTQSPSAFGVTGVGTQASPMVTATQLRSVTPMLTKPELRRGPMNQQGSNLHQPVVPTQQPQVLNHRGEILASSDRPCPSTPWHGPTEVLPAIAACTTSGNRRMHGSAIHLSRAESANPSVASRIMSIGVSAGRSSSATPVRTQGITPEQGLQTLCHSQSHTVLQERPPSTKTPNSCFDAGGVNVTRVDSSFRVAVPGQSGNLLQLHQQLMSGHPLVISCIGSLGLSSNGDSFHRNREGNTLTYRRPNSTPPSVSRCHLRGSSFTSRTEGQSLRLPTSGVGSATPHGGTDAGGRPGPCTSPEDGKTFNVTSIRRSDSHGGWRKVITPVESSSIDLTKQVQAEASFSGNSEATATGSSIFSSEKSSFASSVPVPFGTNASAPDSTKASVGRSDETHVQRQTGMNAGAVRCASGVVTHTRSVPGIRRSPGCGEPVAPSPSPPSDLCSPGESSAANQPSQTQAAVVASSAVSRGNSSARQQRMSVQLSEGLAGVAAGSACASACSSTRGSQSRVPLSTNRPGCLEAADFLQDKTPKVPSTPRLSSLDAASATQALLVNTRAGAGEVEAGSSSMGNGHDGVRYDPTTERLEGGSVPSGPSQNALRNVWSQKKDEAPIVSQLSSDDQTGGASASCCSSLHRSESVQNERDAQLSSLKERLKITAQGGKTVTSSVKGTLSVGCSSMAQPLGGTAAQSKRVKTTDVVENSAKITDSALTETTPCGHHTPEKQDSPTNRRNTNGEKGAAGLKPRTREAAEGQLRQIHTEGDAANLTENVAFPPDAGGEGLSSISCTDAHHDVIPLRTFLWNQDELPSKIILSKGGTHRHQEEDPEDALVNCQLDDFELADFRSGGDASLLGRGTYGVVRKLRQKATGKVYAVKSIEKDSVVRAGMVSQVEFELLVQKDLLRHRNVLRCFACMEDPEQVHLVLEYCSQGDLYTKIRSQPQRRLTEREAFVYFSQLVNGLHYLHSKGVTHRDLKLENLLLDGKNVLKIADLGWCGSVLGKSKNFNFCGTLDYLAPEMIKGVGHDWRVDIWGAGILLYEMLDGKPPFQSTRHLELIQQALKAEVAIPSHIAPDAGDLIVQLLRYDPEDRIPLHALPQHPWVKRMWSELRNEYYAKYPDAEQQRSCASSMQSDVDLHSEKSRSTMASRGCPPVDPTNKTSILAALPVAVTRASGRLQSPAPSQWIAVRGSGNMNGPPRNDAECVKAPSETASTAWLDSSRDCHEGAIGASAWVGTKGSGPSVRSDTTIVPESPLSEDRLRQSEHQPEAGILPEQTALRHAFQNAPDDTNTLESEREKFDLSDGHLRRGSTRASSVDSRGAERSKPEIGVDHITKHSTHGPSTGIRMSPPEEMLEKTGHVENKHGSLQQRDQSTSDDLADLHSDPSETLPTDPNTDGSVSGERVGQRSQRRSSSFVTWQIRSSRGSHSHSSRGNTDTTQQPPDLHDDAAANLPSKKKKAFPSRVSKDSPGTLLGSMTGTRLSRSIIPSSSADQRRGGSRRSISQTTKARDTLARLKEGTDAARAALRAALISRIVDMKRSTYNAGPAGQAFAVSQLPLPTHITSRPSWVGSVRGAGSRATSSCTAQSRTLRGGKSVGRNPVGATAEKGAKGSLQPSRLLATQVTCKATRHHAQKEDTYGFLFEGSDLSETEKNKGDETSKESDTPLMEATASDTRPTLTGVQTQSETNELGHPRSESRGRPGMTTRMRQDGGSHLGSDAMPNHAACSQGIICAPVYTRAQSNIVQRPGALVHQETSHPPLRVMDEFVTPQTPNAFPKQAQTVQPEPSCAGRTGCGFQNAVIYSQNHLQCQPLCHTFQSSGRTRGEMSGGQGNQMPTGTYETQLSMFRAGEYGPPAEASPLASISSSNSYDLLEQHHLEAPRVSSTDVRKTESREVEDFSAFVDHLSVGSTDDEWTAGTSRNIDAALLPSKNRGGNPSATVQRRLQRFGSTSARLSARFGLPRFRNHSEHSVRYGTRGSGSNQESLLEVSNAPSLANERRDGSRGGTSKHESAATSRGKEGGRGGSRGLDTSRLTQKGATQRGRTRCFPNATRTTSTIGTGKTDAGGSGGTAGGRADDAPGAKGGLRCGRNMDRVSKRKESPAAAASTTHGREGDDASLGQHRTMGATARQGSDSSARRLPLTRRDSQVATNTTAGGNTSLGCVGSGTTGTVQEVSPQALQTRVYSSGPIGSASCHPFHNKSTASPVAHGHHFGMHPGQPFRGTGSFTSMTGTRAQSPPPFVDVANRRPRSTPPSAFTATWSQPWSRLSPWGGRASRDVGGGGTGMTPQFSMSVYQDASASVNAQRTSRYTTCYQWPRASAVSVPVKVPPNVGHYNGVPSAWGAPSLSVLAPVNISSPQASLNRSLSPQAGMSAVTNPSSSLRSLQHGPWFQIPTDGGRMHSAGWLDGSMFHPLRSLPMAGGGFSQTIQNAGGEQVHQGTVACQNLQTATTAHRAAAVAAAMASGGNDRGTNAAGANLQPSWSSQSRKTQNAKWI